MRKPSEPRAEEKIKEFFFQHPTMKIHLRALARAVKLSAPATKTACERLEKEEFLERKQEPPLVVYTAAHESRRFREEKQLWNLRQLRKSGFIEYVNDVLARPAIILFGSFAKGEDWERSDIDLFIVADEKRELELEPYEESLGKEFQVFLHTRQEFREMKRTSRELLNNVLNGVILSGYVEVYEAS